MIFKSRVALYYQNNGRCRILFDAMFGKMFNHNILIMYVFVTSSYQYFFYLGYAKSLFKNYILDFFYPAYSFSSSRSIFGISGSEGIITDNHKIDNRQKRGFKTQSLECPLIILDIKP